MDLPTILNRSNSLIDWFRYMDHELSEEFILEDGSKRPRLRRLHSIISLPHETMEEFSPMDIIQNSPRFTEFFQKKKESLCAVRCVPLVQGLPKPRMRGKTLAETLPWFREQQIDPAKYRIEVIDHPSVDHFGTIFIVNAHGIFGEIVRGGHHQLTSGFFSHTPITFRYDFETWKLSQDDPEVRAHLQEIVRLICVPDELRRLQLIHEFGSTFAHNYITGYFETTTSEHGIWYIDYNRVLGKMFSTYTPVSQESSSGLSGNSASPGVVQGRVRKVLAENVHSSSIEDAEILVCDMTTPDFVAHMQNAAAIVTERGGILSHAAIVSREFGKPCVTGVTGLLDSVQDGDMIEVNADTGTITILHNNSS